MSIGALGSALAGIRAASEAADVAALRVAGGAASGDSDMVADMVSLRVAGIQMRASVAVAKASNDMIGTLLDTLA